MCWPRPSRDGDHFPIHFDSPTSEISVLLHPLSHAFLIPIVAPGRHPPKYVGGSGAGWGEVGPSVSISLIFLLTEFLKEGPSRYFGLSAAQYVDGSERAARRSSTARRRLSP